MTVEPSGTPKLQISHEDLETPEIDERVSQMRAAQAVPLVRAVGGPAAGPTAHAAAWWRGNVPTLGLAGIVGGVVGWALIELIAQPDQDNAWYGTGRTIGSVIAFTLFAMALGLLLHSWDAIQARSWPKVLVALKRGAPAIVGAGIVGGFLGEKLFETVVDPAVERAFNEDDVDAAVASIRAALHLGRGLALAAAAATVGLALGVAGRSTRHAVNAAIGGVVGGFLGGFLFDYVADALHAESGVLPRLVAFGLSGAVIGVGIGTVESVRKEHWLEIVSGGMAGKQFILYHEQTRIGSAPDADITLIKDPGVQPRHLVLQRGRGGQQVAVMDPQHPVLVNGALVGDSTLNDGDLLHVGRTVLRYREKAQSMPVTGQIH